MYVSIYRYIYIYVLYDYIVIYYIYYICIYIYNNLIMMCIYMQQALIRINASQHAKICLISLKQPQKKKLHFRLCCKQTANS